uniref:Uncharacterized protein n=1 Tax=Ensifer adhaerens TaxID=106592 RepID=D1CSC8_ENSAD|nr:hypothetical protein [Ensifer adhaerens]
MECCVLAQAVSKTLRVKARSWRPRSWIASLGRMRTDTSQKRSGVRAISGFDEASKGVLKR